MPASSRPSASEPIVSPIFPSISYDLLHNSQNELTGAMVRNCMLVVPVLATTPVSCSTMRPDAEAPI